MQTSQSRPGQVAAAIKNSSAAQRVPAYPASLLPHGHEGEGTEVVAKLLGGMKVANADGSETATDPS